MTTTCPGCGKPVDLTRRGYCALCGTNVACVPEGGQMKYLLRYFCAYCLSRMAFQAVRSIARRPAQTAKPCVKHGHGVALTLFVLLPFAGVMFLIVLGLAAK